jgi:hypothetical protein
VSPNIGFEERRIVRIDKVELALIHILLLYPDKISLLHDETFLEYFTTVELKRLAVMLTDSFKKGNATAVSDLVGEMEEGTLKDTILKLLVEPSPFDPDIVDKVVTDVMNKLRARWYKSKRKILQRELMQAQESDNQELKNRLLIEKEKLLKEEKTRIFKSVEL